MVLKIDRPYGRKVLRFDGGFAAESCGIVQGPRSGPGSEGSKGSEGSEGKVSPSASFICR